jgi:lactoylglutathione lyase
MSGSPIIDWPGSTENKIVTAGRLLPSLFLFGLCMTSSADDATEFAFTFDHIALSIADPARSGSFYESVFGLEEIGNRTEIEGIRWYSLGGGKELHLISIGGSSDTPGEAAHFALTTPNFEKFVEKLRLEDIPFSDFAGTPGEVSIRADGTRQIYLQDPDGNWIEVNSTAAD